MEVDPIILSLALFGRVYCSMTAEEGEAVALKTVEVAGKDADIVDLINAFDDVWGASLLAGTIGERECTPPHPLPLRQRWINNAKDEDEVIFYQEQDDSYFNNGEKHTLCKRYKNKNLIAVIKENNKKRRYWDK